MMTFAKTQDLKQKLYKIENDVAKIESIQMESKQMESNIVENKEIVIKPEAKNSLSPKIGGAIKSFRQ